ncbi:MAG: HAMP domain-containing sensor histidine kinase [Thermonemataceae bacterium]|nr:HAMP domain-containing sensor histidine kinase [Thermonemataceae bacterium]
MSEYPISNNEEERLKNLYKYKVLDTLPEQAYNDLVALSAQVCQTPIALVSLLDKDRQWFKSRINLSLQETKRCDAFCNYTILQTEVFEVEDSLQDIRFQGSKLVKDTPFIRFYAGAPLISPEGFALGTICVLDTKPNKLDDKQKNALQILARQVVHLLELHLKNKLIEENQDKICKELEHSENKREISQQVLSLFSHDLRSPIIRTKGITELLLLEDDIKGEVKDFIADVRVDINLVLESLDNALSWVKMQQNGFALQFKEHSLTDIVLKNIQLFSNLALKKKIDFSYNYPDTQIKSDKFLINSIIYNLLSNAFKFTPESGSISLHIFIENNLLHIIVKDTGIGIPSELMQKFRKDEPLISRKGTKGEKGSGVGLQVIKHFISLLGGSIKIESQEQKGAIFEVILPINV